MYRGLVFGRYVLCSSLSLCCAVLCHGMYVYGHFGMAYLGQSCLFAYVVVGSRLFLNVVPKHIFGVLFVVLLRLA